MARKKNSSPGGCAVRQAALLEEILRDLQSTDDGTRAAAVRELCPCRTAWDVPVQRYVAAMLDDPSRSVRHEAHHVLDEDSNWGKRLADRRVKADLKADPEDEAAEDEMPGRYSIAWQRPRRPRARKQYYPTPRISPACLGTKK